MNGTSAYVTIPSAPSLQNSNAITVEAWVFPEPSLSYVNNNNGWFIVKSDGQSVSSARSYEISWQTNNINGINGPTGAGVAVQLFLNAATWAGLGANLPESNWVHVAFTFNSASGLLQLFTNGVLSSSTTNDISGTVPLAGQFLRQTTLPLNLGGERISEGPLFAAGYMDEVRIWNTNRTSIQIEESRFCRLTGTESNLVGYWSFDGTNAIDLTGNGNNGTLEGGAVIVPINGPDVVHDGVCGAPYIDPASLSYSAATGFRQKILGPSGMTLAVETSTNLADWSTLFILPNFTGEFEFDDVDDIGLPQRFYRVVPQ